MKLIIRKNNKNRNKKKFHLNFFGRLNYKMMSIFLSTNWLFKYNFLIINLCSNWNWMYHVYALEWMCTFMNALATWLRRINYKSMNLVKQLFSVYRYVNCDRNKTQLTMKCARRYNEIWDYFQIVSACSMKIR